MKRIDVAPLSDAWFEYRARRVTGSTAAAILGLANPRWGSPLAEWQRLTGRAQRSNVVEEWHLWGQESEAFNRSLYQRKTGRIVDPFRGIAQHSRIGWLCYTPDGVIIAGDASGIALPALWEAKAPAPFKAEAWSEQIPLEYQVQAQIGMEVMGLHHASFSALIWPGIKTFDVARDQRFIDLALGKIQRFLDWNVARDIPPEARAGERDREVLAELAAPIEWEWTPEVDRHVGEVERLQAEIAERENVLDGHKNRLVQLTGTKGWKFAKDALKKAQKVTA